MNDKSDKALKIIAGILCCVLVVAIAALVIHSSGKLQKPQATESAPIVTDSQTSESTSATDATTESTTTAPRDVNSVSVLVNKDNPVPDGWQVDLVNLRNNQQIDRRAYGDLQKMFDDARTAGCDPIIRSSYRTHQKQTSLYNNKVSEYKNQGNSEAKAKELAAGWVAVPGTSEHELGLALDIVSSENKNLDESQMDSKCQRWLIENSWKYGYILRYPNDKKEITKINFEPWHYRYVGKDVAKEIHEKGICLEEYYMQ